MSAPKLTVPDVLPVAKEYVALPQNSVGGSLHIVLEDDNIDNHSVDFCIQWAKDHGDEAGVRLGEMIRRLTITQRKKLVRMIYA